MEPSDFARSWSLIRATICPGILVAALMCSPSLSAKESDGSEPIQPEMQAAQASYLKNLASIKSAREARTAKILPSYLAALERIQHEITVSGDLTAAAEVSAETDRATAKQEPSEEQRKAMPAKLLALRSAYERDRAPSIAEAVKQEEQQFRTYIGTLEALQRRLTTQNKVDGALQVKMEIDRLLFENTLVRMAGTWNVKYANGTTRRYIIDTEGNVSWAGATGKITKTGKDLVLDFNDGKLERVTRTATGLLIEHFNPKTSYPSKADTRGTATKG